MSRSAWLLLAKAGLSIGLVAWLLASADLGRLWVHARRLEPAYLLGAALFFAAQGLVVAWRWRAIVRLLGGALPLGKAIQWVFVGQFFNNALPTSVGGDVVRIWTLHRHGSAPGMAFASVAIERATGVTALGLMVSACTPLAWASLPVALRWPLVALGPGLVLVLVLLALAEAPAERWLPERLSRQVVNLAGGLKRMGASPMAALEIMVLGVAAQVGVIGAGVVLGAGLAIDQPAWAYVLVIGGGILLSVLPVSVGGWGVREAGMVTVFGYLGVPAEPVLALSVLWALVMLVVSLPAGVLWWLGGGVSGRAVALSPADELPGHGRPPP